MKADLHVHSWHSTRSGSLPFLRSYDCYSDPVDVYRTARARGMDLVTITDHDSIDGCLELLNRCPGLDDVFISEEVSCRFPDGDIDVHLGVYGTTEALHRAVQPLRRNVFDVIACLRAHRVLFTLNHPLHFYRGQVPLASYLQLALEVPALEARNGTMLAEHNALIEQFARAVLPGGGVVGGSDAHTLRRIGRTWTEVPGATTMEEFMRGLRQGHGRPGGEHGGAQVLALEIYGVVARYLASLVGFGPCTQPAPRRLACLAFGALSIPFLFIPLVTALRSKAHERRAVAQMRREFESAFTRAVDTAGAASEVQG